MDSTKECRAYLHLIIAELSGSKLQGVDLSSCNMDGARVGIDELRGATINLKQAISLLQSAGIYVKLSTNND